MNEYAIYLDAVQFRALRVRICGFLRAHPERRRRKGRARLTISDVLRLTLLTFRGNHRQRLLAGLFKVSQSTVSRVVAWMRRVLRVVLAGCIPQPGGLEAVVTGLLAGTGRPIILLVDGTLVPVGYRKNNRQDYSGKHHKAGKNLQIVSDVSGNLLYVAPALPGRTHDRRAVADSGVEAALGHPRLLVHADKGYLGTDFIVPARSSKHHPLTLEQRAENLEINTIRCAVERAIAHLKILDILHSGIRTRGQAREAIVEEIIAVALGLVFFRQKWVRS
jgi:hypothetical protein